jgi:hypothetical protein
MKLKREYLITFFSQLAGVYTFHNSAPLQIQLAWGGTTGTPVSRIYT